MLLLNALNLILCCALGDDGQINKDRQTDRQTGLETQTKKEREGKVQKCQICLLMGEMNTKEFKD